MSSAFSPFQKKRDRDRIRLGIKPGADVKRREGGIGENSHTQIYHAAAYLLSGRGHLRGVGQSNRDGDEPPRRQGRQGGGEGEKLLFYPQMTQMTQIFFGGGTYCKLKLELRTAEVELRLLLSIATYCPLS